MPQTLGWSVFWLCVLFTALATWAIHHYQNAVLQQRLETLTRSAVTQIHQRFELYQYGLRGLRGAIVTTGVQQFTRTSFDTYMESRDVAKEFRGARGFGVIRKVAESDQAAFIAQAKAETGPHFKIRQITPHGGEQFVIQYLWPYEGNEGAVGLDIASEANRHQAALQAAQTNEAQLTRPITLVQADGLPRRGFLVMLPFYRPNVRLQTAEDRIQATLGWSYAALVVDDVLDGLQTSFSEIAMTLTDTEEAIPFYTSSQEKSFADKTTALSIQKELQVQGRTWRLQTTALPTMATAAGIWPLGNILMIGLMLSAGVALVAYRTRLSTMATSNTPLGAEGFGLRQFAKTPWVHSTMLTYAGITFVGAVLGLTYQWQQQMQEAANKLQQSVTAAAALSQQAGAEYRKAVAFLASTASTIELVQELDPATTSNNPEKIEALRTNVANTLKAYLLSSPEVFQARLIGMDNDGLELVRVERNGEQFKVVRKTDLQAKGQEPYMQAARGLSEGQTWVSELSLNREYGQITQPERPTLRYISPLFTAHNKLFGVIVLNVDARSLLANLAKHAPQHGAIYATTSSGNFVLHPDATRTFGADRGHPYTWANAFSLATMPWGIDPEGWRAWHGEQGDILAATADVSPNDSVRTGGLRVIAAIPLNNVVTRFWHPLILPFLGWLGLGLIGGLVLYWRWSQHARAEKSAQQDAQMTQQQQERLLFQGILESAPEAMLVVDATGTILLANAQLEQLFGYPNDDLLGQPVETLLPEAVAATHRTHVQTFCQSPRARPMGKGQILLARRADGECFPVEVSLGPIQHANHLMIVASVRDLTHQRQFEDLLRQARDQAEQANQAKSTFLANMSHEIRTPLNAVIGLTSLLSSDDLNAQQRSHVQKIQLAGRALLGIVNDVLDLAKIEADEVTLEAVPCRLDELLAHLESVFGTQAEVKGLTFVLEQDPHLPEWVLADKNRLGQILTNLLGNALKFTTSGEIKLKAEVLDPPESDENTRHTVNIQFTVSDTGIGVPEAALPRLFDPFSQGDGSTARQFGGTGLGLSIVKRMATLMQGEVGVQSIRGQGSQFWIRLPFHRLEADQIPPLQGGEDPIRVLLAEDHPEERQRLIEMIHALGWHHLSASNGKELVEIFHQRHAGGRRPFDALIVDWQMPEMDGLTALDVLAREVGAEQLPAVLMISAYEHEQIVGLDKAHLVDKILHKPVNASQLFNAVNDIVTAQTGKNMRVLQATSPEAVTARWLPNIRILVADDSEINLEVVMEILSRSGAIVTTVTDGQAALDCLREQVDAFDAVLMDVQMPDMDGLETTRHIRHTLGLTLPVIALTAGALLEEKRRAIEAGMNDFLTKPLEPNQLISRVRAAVEQYRGQTIPIESTLQDAAPTFNPWPDIAGIDQETAERLMLGNLHLFTTALSRLLATDLTPHHPSTDADIEDPVWRQTAAASVHKLRGSAGMIGAIQLHQCATQAEQDLRTLETNPLEALAALHAELEKLRIASQPTLTALKNQQSTTTIADNERIPLDDTSLAELNRLLTQHDLEALEQIEKWADPLRARFGEEIYTQLHTQIMGLNFNNAHALLQSQPDSASASSM